MENKENKKAWLVKYALTTGFIECELVETHKVTYKRSITEYAHLRNDEKGNEYIKHNSYVVGKDVALTYTEAKEIACKMRDNKIKSLERQIDKLKKMEF